MDTIPLCPITQQPLRDPVVDPEGNTYERTAIMDWLARHPTSPLTRAPLTPDMLVPNRALRDLIESKGALKSALADLTAIPATVTRDPPAQEGPHSIKFNYWSAGSDSTYYGFEISGPDTEEPLHPVHICCVIDVSGSMDDNALIPGSGAESSGMSLLSLVKHATRTIMESLGPNDRLSIVSFSDDAKVELDAVPMSEQGRIMAREILERLQPDQSTNLGAGLLAGIKTAASTGSQFSSVFLLTDGVPTDQDLDFKGAMRRQFKKFPLFGSLHTFGFGYSLNSQLLRLISKEGDGVFAFIPDAGMVGTIFINAIANIRTVYAVKSRLVLPAIVDSSLIVGDYRVETDPDAQTTTIHLPSLRYGQSTDILVRFPVGHALSKALKVDNCKLIACNLIEEFSIQPSLFPDFTKEQELFQMARANASVNMFKASVDDKNSHAALAEICARLESKRANNETLDALCRDLSGQVTMAYSRDDWFQRWGKHYLLSVAFAYMHQICNNFKDPGVQLYGRGRLFIKMQGQLNDLFLSLPPPPRRQTYSNYSSYQSQTSGAGAAPIDMTLYNNAGGVCFHPSCLVRMATGESKAIARLQKGDLIQTKNSVAEVRCVVFNQLPHGYCKMVCVGGERLWLTEYHPVRVDGGQWTFAKDLADAKGELIPTDFVCNLVLDDGHCVTIDGVQCCTLGHAFTDNEVIRHDYFGTQAVINDLSQLNGWNTGRVVIQSQQIVRDEKSKKVSQIRHYLTAGSAV